MRSQTFFVVAVTLLAVLADARAAPVISVGKFPTSSSSPAQVADDNPALSLEEVTRAALEQQPLLQAQAAQVEAHRQRAIAAGELPDPQLLTGISELPVNTADAWSFTRDGDTDIMVGVMQEFPRAVKRRLRRSKVELQAMSAHEELVDLVRRIRRDAGLVFLDVLLAEKSAAFARAQVDETESQLKASTITVRAGAISQDQTLAASVAVADLQDRERAASQDAAIARERLRRWIGDQADRDISMELPSLPAPLLPADVVQHLERHPALRKLDRQEDIARTELELAQAAYKPDWRLEVGYGYRPAFSEMLSLRFSVDLPLFTRNRQARGAAAAHEELRQAAALREDELRHHIAESAALYQQWRSFHQRAERYAAAALPAARARVDAAVAAFRAAEQSLSAVFEARAALLDAELRSLELHVDALRSRLEVDYFLAEDTP